ncbi:hypothetical protein [Longivirga aurantiaca]|uniref:ASCH domain-containing protein n=1 Tax=Longivirga aurantiaca TaxID=1837743 RepID=A0ABW1SWD3_9ACTN
MATEAQATTLAGLGHARPLSRRPLAQWIVAHTRRGRLKRYARAMGWYLTTDGVLVGDVEGIAIRAYEDRKHIAVVELVAPAVLPRFEVRQREKSTPQIGDGMREVHTGDAHFDACYSLRAEEPWLIRAIVDSSVRQSLVAAPVQSITAVGDRLVSRGGSGLDPLDLLARGTALRTLLQAVPWEAYPDRRTIPTQAAVYEVVRERQMRPVEPLPSVGRRA